MAININDTAEQNVKTTFADKLPQLWTYVKPQLDISVKMDNKTLRNFVDKLDLVAIPMLYKMYKKLRPYFKRFDGEIDNGI